MSFTVQSVFLPRHYPVYCGLFVFTISYAPCVSSQALSLKPFTTNVSYRKHNRNQYHVYTPLTLTSAKVVFYASSQALACLPAFQRPSLPFPASFLRCFMPLPTCFLALACLSLLPSCLVVCHCMNGSMPVSLHGLCCLYLWNFTQVPLPACFCLWLLLPAPAWLPACFPACLDAFSGLF
jgi:hypothetical protein